MNVMKATQLPICLLLFALISGGSLLAQGVTNPQTAPPLLETPGHANPDLGPANVEDVRPATVAPLGDPQHPVNPDPEMHTQQVLAAGARQLTPAEIEELKDGK